MRIEHHGSLTTVMRTAAEHACRAPSVHNTQPWRWRVGSDWLELYAVPGRQLPVIDPDGRLMYLSCGAALHHAVIALAAVGWETSVQLFPDSTQPDLLARITVTADAGVNAYASRLLHAVHMRHTDRRPLVEARVPDSMLELLGEAARHEGAGLHLLPPQDIADLAAAATLANQAAVVDPDMRAELGYWTGGAHPKGTGLPDEVLLDQPGRTPVPGRDFLHAGVLFAGSGEDRGAVYAVLCRDGDEPVDWLRAGEALSAVWLKATDWGVAVLPLSSVVELSATWTVLRRMLSNLAYPMLVLRLGMAGVERSADVPRTPRLPFDEVIYSTEEA